MGEDMELKKNTLQGYTQDTYAHPEDHFWGDLVRNNVIQLSTLLVGLVMAAVVTFATIRLAPILARLDSVEASVNSLINKGKENEQVEDKVIGLEENVKLMREDVKEMKQDIKSLLQKQ